MRLPAWVTFPDKEWEVVDPAAAGLNPDQFARWSKHRSFGVGGVPGDTPGGYGAVLTRGGKMVATWGDPEHLWSSASVGKLFVKLALQLAADHGRIGRISDLVADHWVGDGRDGQGVLNHPSKFMTSGHHQTLRFVHLASSIVTAEHIMIEDGGHLGGFPVSNGEHWRRGQRVPHWADWHGGDADRANYAHVEPGTELRYSSGGVWRLSQALTYSWDADLKDVLDERLLHHIGIPADAWHWRSGQDVLDDPIYGVMPEYASFCDLPREIRGHVVRGGGGWVVMTPSDLARVGHLMATGGWWEGEQLIRLHPHQTTPGHTGGGGSCLQAYRSWDTIDLYVSYAQVTAAGFDLIPHKLDLAGLVTGDPEW